MKEGNMSPYQEAPIPQRAARMATERETRDMFIQMGPDEAMRVLDEMRKLAKSGVKRDMPIGQVMDELEKKAEK